jgi:hypothetical protein
VPFTETDTVYFGAALEQTKIVTEPAACGLYLAYANQFGYTSNGVPLTIGWVARHRDSALVPNSGATSASTASGVSAAMRATSRPATSTSSTGR